MKIFAGPPPLSTTVVYLAAAGIELLPGSTSYGLPLFSTAVGIDFAACNGAHTSIILLGHACAPSPLLLGRIRLALGLQLPPNLSENSVYKVNTPYLW